MSHTPAPWTIHRDADLRRKGAGRWINAPGDTFVVDLDGVIDADAALIAAAPELLAACEAALSLLSDMDADDGDAAKTLRAAVAKARGTR